MSAARGARTHRIGVFGGTFDPPHVGHLAIAECARDQLGLARVLFIPSGTPPHKIGRVRTPAAARLAMTRLAVRGQPAFEVWTGELRRRGPSFTIDTLRALERHDPRAELVLIIGADNLADLPSWREPDAIVLEATLAVAGRHDTRPRSGAAARFARRAVWLDSPLLDLSSTDIRARACAGRSLRYLVPDPVERYIVRHRLYAGAR